MQTSHYKQVDAALSVMAIIETTKGAGFILDTLTQDGKALNACIILSEPTAPGTIMHVTPVGMFNKTIVCVPRHAQVSTIFKNRERAITTIKRAYNLFFKTKSLSFFK